MVDRLALRVVVEVWRDMLPFSHADRGDGNV